jgi:hypothetical protein
MLASLSLPLSRIKGEQHDVLVNKVLTKVEEIVADEKWGNSLKG